MKTFPKHNGWKSSLPLLPVSRHSWGCSGERAQPRPRFLSTCSFLQRTMTGRSAGQAILAEQAEKPFPPAGMGRTSQSRTALPQSSSVPTLLQGLGQKLLQGVLCTCVTANSIDLRETRRMCSCLGSLQLFPPCKGIILVQNTAGDLPAAFWGLG